MQQKKHKLKEEAPPIEEVVLNETKLVKVEEGDEDDLPHDNLAEYDMLKNEQIIYDESLNEYNNTQSSEEGEEFEKLFKISATDLPETQQCGENRISMEIQFDNETELPLAAKEVPRKRKNARDEKKTYICDQCGNHFTANKLFRIHLQRHTGVKEHQCEICSSKFFSSSELKRHMRRHTGEKPFACRQCERSFSDYSTRVRHERTHSNERPFICSHCGKGFTTPYILRNHIVIHTGERSFRCDFCNKSYQSQSHLVTHRRSIMHKQNVEKHQEQLNVTGSQDFR